MVELIIFLPLISSMIVGIYSRKINHTAAEILTSTLLVSSAAFAWLLFVDVIFNGNNHVIYLFRWIDVESFKASWSLYIDSLTAVMLVVVTTVSALVHIYSCGYMHNDNHIPRFMSYLSLFTFFMLMLVTSDNFIQLFLGWEGVGLCSYLLIGFWFKKESANNAAMKAFIVNRVGDFAFALGIFTIFLIFDTVNFKEVFAMAPKYVESTIQLFGVEYHSLTVICILLFVGAMGKSAQIGLHTWLPDAMEGPTPVSALIHAATMVTAGVFLVVRCSPLFELSVFARDVITIVGSITCVFAATIALTQNDIKKIIAYSTCSQLGYMFFACGVSAYSAAVFHLMTHAFFKALLFLGAGSVIHAMSGEQDIRKMGGIWNKIPVTYSMMWFGSLALSGVYPFAGFYSKDVILEASFASGTELGIIAYSLGIMAAFCTAFYSWRLILVVFHGQSNASKSAMTHIHESPFSMIFPLLILAIGSIFSGVVFYNLGIVNSNLSFWHDSIAAYNVDNNILEKLHHVPEYIKLLPSIVGIIGIFLAYILYVVYPNGVSIFTHSFKPLYNLLLNKYYIDEIYEFLFVRPIKNISDILWRKVDINIIDEIGPNGVARLSQYLGFITSKLQSGYLYTYSFMMISGVVVILTWVIYKFI